MTTVIKALVLLVLGFGGLQIAKPHIASYQFGRMIRDEVESQTVRMRPADVHKRILEMGRTYGINLKEDDVSVEGLTNGGFQVRVRYEMPVDLYVTHYVTNFDHEQRTKNAGVPQ